ncbi:hypothetical protein COU61_04085 [Candidatus Pacearchaeota archaeon CG10_big_fil_rev_8_21_14_0_10_35_13]|nr:MAG: hypothetical protein COU61_04085 [Candidatus Pacearchaeota archaeon CG10_big_fil_rev_8_21_14_0_10_35_13]
MERIFVKNINNVLNVISELRKKLGVGLKVVNNFVTITGEEVKIYDTVRVLKALEVGFPANTALLLCDPEFLFETISIKSISRRKNLKEVRARIIGTEGKTKRTIESISNCFLKIKDNYVFIIGTAEEVVDAHAALDKLIHGSKQSKVYSYLERSRRKYKDNIGLLEDLGNDSVD